MATGAQSMHKQCEKQRGGRLPMGASRVSDLASTNPHIFISIIIDTIGFE
jgi:hypothetical protein